MQVNSSLSATLEKYLDLSNLQLKLTADNMANLDTPGYRTKGIDFAAEMQRSMTGLQSGTAGLNAQPGVTEVDGLLERPDGNNVSMDREGLNMAAAQLRFRTGVALLRSEFSQMESAIHEDTK